MPVPNLSVIWFTSLKKILSKREMSTLAELHQNADSHLEKYRLTNFLMTDPEIGLQRYYVKDAILAPLAAKIIALQEKCFAGVKLVQEDWSPLFSPLEKEQRTARAIVGRFAKSGKHKPSHEVFTLAERRICIAEALENAAYHSYAQQNPSGIKAIIEAMIKAEGFEALRTGKSRQKDAEKSTEALLSRKIFELLSTNISVKQVKVVNEVKLEEAA